MMKSFRLLIGVMMVLCWQNLFAEEVFNGEHNVASWNAQQLPVADYPVLSKASAGDLIAITVTAIEDNAWVSLQDKDWQMIAGCHVNITAAQTVYFPLTEATAQLVKEGGIMVTGQNYTFNKVELLYQKTLWTGDVDDNTGWAQSDVLDNNLFKDLQAGQPLGIEVSAINDGESYHQYALRKNWEDNIITASVSEARCYIHTLTSDNVADLQTATMIVVAQFLKVTALYTYVTEKSDGGQTDAGETYTAWAGEKVYGSSWSAWEQIPATAFANAQKDMILRFKFKDVGAGAQFKLSTSAWTDMPDAPIANIEGLYQQYTLTDALLTELKANGGIVSGVSFTLISIEVINPADLKPLTLSVPVTGNWVFDGKPAITIHVENPYDEAVTANAVVAIATDKMNPITTIQRNVEVAAHDSKDIELTTEADLAAGIYKATCTVNDDLARAFFFAVNPTEIISAADQQNDFDSYWETAMDQLAAVEATDEPVLTEIPSKSTAKRKVYLVEFKSVPDGLSGEPVTVRGYYCEPQDGEKHPVIMHYLGYDSGYRPGGQGVEPWCPDGDGDDLSGDYAEFILSCRGQSVNNRPAAERADGIDRDFENTYGDWFAFHFGQKDSYYYRGAYMDCVRAIDFMATRATSDMDNLYAEGQSQGGAFTVAAAALSGRTFKAIAPAITFMGDFPDYFEIVSWPAYVARECQQAMGMSDEEMYAFLSYYDTKNLATRISCPIITSIGIQDNVCPAHTNLAPYNNVTTSVTDKQILYNPELQHQTPANWYNTYMQFFKNYYQTAPTAIDMPIAFQQEENDVAYNLLGQRVTPNHKGLYIMCSSNGNQSGKKMILK